MSDVSQDLLDREFGGSLKALEDFLEDKETTIARYQEQIDEINHELEIDEERLNRCQEQIDEIKKIKQARTK